MGRNSLLTFDRANVNIISSIGSLDEGSCVQLILRLFPTSTGRCVTSYLPVGVVATKVKVIGIIFFNDREKENLRGTLLRVILCNVFRVYKSSSDYSSLKKNCEVRRFNTKYDTQYEAIKSVHC